MKLDESKISIGIILGILLASIFLYAGFFILIKFIRSLIWQELFQYTKGCRFQISQAVTLWKFVVRLSADILR